MKRIVAIVLLVFVTACSKSQPSTTTATARTGSVPTGVSVDTGSALLPLSTFSLGIAHTLPVRNTPNAVPNVPGVKAFVVNVPNVSASDLKLYWVRDLDLIFSDNQAPIQADVRQNDSAGFHIAPPDLPEKGGYLMLVIGSSSGGPNRYYAVALRS